MKISSAIIATALVLLPSAVHARVDQPDHIIYGNASIFGNPAGPGAVIEMRTVPDNEVLARYELGRDPRLGQQYSLATPMDDVDPRIAGRARPGDPVRIYIGSQLSAETTVGQPGRAVRLDIDPQNMGTGPSISVSDASLFEGNDGAMPTAVLTVSMNTTHDVDIMIDWQTAADTAVGGVGCAGETDYITAEDQLTIPGGSQTGQITVDICGDTQVEPDEVFMVNLLNAQPAGVFGDPGAVVTVKDDDNVPQVSVADVWVTEPRSGSSQAVFNISLSRNNEEDVEVDWQTSGNNAAAPADYVEAGGSVTIPAGQLTAQVAVTVNADGFAEPNESFNLDLSNPVQATLGDARALGVIVDPGYDPAVEHNQDVVDESNGVTGIADPSGVAITPDGEHVYVTSRSLDSVAAFSRRPGDGVLTPIATFDSQSAGFEGMLLDSPADIVISPDGNHVYMAARNDNSVVVLARNPASGSVTFVENKLDETLEAGSMIRGLSGASRLLMSDDGRHLYVSGSNADGLAVFERDPATGTLTFLEAEENGVDDPDDAGGAPQALDQPAGMRLSPDGGQLYLATRTGDAVVVFDRTVDDGSPDFGRLSYRTAYINGLSGIEGLDGASDIAITDNGEQLFVAAEESNAVTHMNRAPDGSLSMRVVRRQGDPDLPGLGGPQRVVLSPDNTELFVTGFADSSLTLFERMTEARDGFDIGDLRVRQTLFDEQGTVLNMAGPTAMAASADDAHLYVVATVDDAVVVFGRISVDILFRDGFESPQPPL